MAEISLDNTIAHVAGWTGQRFGPYVTTADVSQELWLYCHSTGLKHVQKHLEDQDDYRLRKLLFGAARQYAEREKAEQCGYSFDDVAWYSPAKLADLVPIALDPTWDGQTGAPAEDIEVRAKTDGREGGTLLAMIADVRSALKRTPGWESASDFDPDTEDGYALLLRLSARLGGEFPEAPGFSRRRAVSNSAARALTRNGWNE